MSVLSTLFGNRFSKPSGRRRGHDARLNHTVRSNRLEGLEKRQMLTADVSFDLNLQWQQNKTTATDGSYTVDISRVGAEPGGIDVALAGGDGIYIHNTFDAELDTSAYSFYEAPNLNPATRAFASDWSTNGTLISHLVLEEPSLAETGSSGYTGPLVKSYVIDGFNLDPTSPGRRSFRSNASVDINYVNKITVSSTGKVSTTTDTLTLWDFTDIVATAAGDDVRFEYMGGSLDFDKPTFVDFNGRTDSEFFVGSPLTAAGTLPGSSASLEVEADVIDINADVSVGGDIMFETFGDGVVDPEGKNDVDKGIFVRRQLHAGGNDITFVSNGADVRLEAQDGTIASNGGGALNNFSLDLTDASAFLGGSIDANTYSVMFRESTVAAGPSARTISTIDPSTNNQRGVLSGGELGITLNNQVAGKSVAVLGEDGVIDLVTDVNSLRLSTGNFGTELDYNVTIVNDGNLDIESVFATEGSIDLSSTNGTIDVDAVIDTSGPVRLATGADLVVGTQLISGAGSIVLESDGDIDIDAAVRTEAITGEVSITAGGDVAISSLVSAAVLVDIDAGGDVSTTGQTSSLVSPTATIVSGAAIDVGLRVEQGVSASAQTGVILRDLTQAWTLDDDGGTPADPADDLYLESVQLELEDVQTADGTITVDAIRSILATEVRANGAGGISLTTTQGNIEILDVIAPGDLVTLDAQGFESSLHDEFGDALDLLNGDQPVQIGGVITLDDIEAPILADVIDFTVFKLDADDSLSIEDYEEFFVGVGTVAGSLVGPGDMIINADTALNVNRATTLDGAIELTALGGLTIGGTGVSAGFDILVGLGSEVRLAAAGGSLVLGAPIVTADPTASVTLAALGDITVSNPTVVVTASTVEAYAGLTGSAATVGSVAAPLVVSGINSTDEVTVTSGETGAAAGWTEDTFTGVTDAEYDVQAFDPTAKPAEIHISGVTSISAGARASNEVSLTTTGANAVLKVTNAEVDLENGTISINSAYDVEIDISGGGGISVNSSAPTAGDSSIDVVAGRYINNDNGGDLQAKTVSLTASTFNEVATPGYVDATLFDTAEEFSASSTSPTGQIYLDFDRTADLELTGIQSSGAVTIVLADGTAVETPNLIIGVGNVAAGAAAQVSLTADGGISSTTETGVVPGSITGGTATLTALDDAVDVTTAVGQIAVDAFGVTITQNGDVQIAPAGIDSDAGAGEITLNVVGGSILSGTGVLEGSSASLVVANNVDVLTNVDTLSVAAAGDIAVVETNALALGDGGIASEAGDVSLTLTAGGLDSALQTISGNEVVVELVGAGNIDITTTATEVSATAADGTITIENNGTFTVADDGITADDGTPGGDETSDYNDVTLTATGGNILAGSGRVTGNVLTVEANGSIDLVTMVTDISATNVTGDISVQQDDHVLVVTNLTAATGAVSVVVNDGDLDLTGGVITANGARNPVTLTTTGTDVYGLAAESAVTLDIGSVITDGGTATVSAAGVIEGAGDEASGDIVAESVVLSSTADDIIAVSAETDNLSATALVAAGNIEVYQINQRPVFIGGGLNPTILSASGDIDFYSRRGDDAAVDGNDIIVLEMPDEGTPNWDTPADVVYAVTSSSMTSSGNLNEAITNISSSPNIGTGGTRAAFSSNIRSGIRLSETLIVDSALTLNGRQRINTVTGGYTIGAPIGIDGSRMSGGDVIGIDIGAGANEASISGLALYGFTDNGGAAIQVGGGVTDVNISNNLIGLRENGRANRNENGIIVKDAASLTIDGNVIGRSSETGILVQPTQIDGTTDLTITNNMIGTNITRRNYRNKNAIILDGTGSNGGTSGVAGDDTFYISGTNIIQDNMIAYSRSGSGINVRGATDVDIIDNTITLNGIGISVGDNDALANDTYSSNVNVFGNEITRSSGNGIFVGDSSENVVIGSTNTGEGNRIGTNVRNRRGLGNRHNGVHINAAGPGVEISGNSIVGNGARRTSNGRSGIRLQEQLESVTISENNISSNREHGIQVDAAVAGTAVAADIQKNMLFRNYGSGIHLTNTTFALNIGSSTPSTANPTDVGNDFISNRRFGIDASSGDATIGGNKMLGNRRGGIDGTAAPVISAASLVSDDLTVDFGDVNNAPLANGEVHFYLGTGRSSRSQGLTYLGKTTTNGATAQFILTNLAAELRVRVGSSITMTYTPTGAGTSEFSRNVSVRRA